MLILLFFRAFVLQEKMSTNKHNPIATAQTMNGEPAMVCPGINKAYYIVNYLIMMSYACLVRGVKRSVETVDAATRQSNIRSILEALKSRGLIADESQWPVPDFEIVRSVLELTYTPKLCGVDDALESVVSLARDSLQSSNSSKAINLVAGLSGMGKSRILYESAASLVQSQSNCGALAITFGGKQHAADFVVEPEIAMLALGPHVPVLTRLMHLYMNKRIDNWTTFASCAVDVFQRFGPQLDLTIGDVIDMIAERHGLTHVVLLVDKAHRYMTMEEAIKKHNMDQNMCFKAFMRSTCEVTDKAGRAVIFSAFSPAIFPEDRATFLSRPIQTTMLSPLAPEHSRNLAKIVVGSTFEYVDSFGLSDYQINQVLGALAIGGVPRSAVELHIEIDKKYFPTCSYGTLLELASNIQWRMTSNSNGTEWTLIALALAGVKAWPNDKVPPTRFGCTGLKLAICGHLSLSSNQRNVELRFPPVVMLASLNYIKQTPGMSK